MITTKSVNRPDDHVKVNISFGPDEPTTRWWKSDKTFFVKDATKE